MAEAARRIYFVIGEESGDALGADLIDAFAEIGLAVEPMGLGGARMRERGVASLFDISDISVMGIAAVFARLPMIISRLRMTVRDIVARQPDLIVLIDSPDFTHRVAKRVRARLPGVPIVKYVCPSVWAWRPGRARTMKAYIDHVLALLPFEPELLKELGGPDATYVGHPLARRFEGLSLPDRTRVSDPARLLVLPGSRRGEIRSLLPDIGETLDILEQRGVAFRAMLPAVPHLEEEIRASIAGWRVKPEIISGEAGKMEAFRTADVALAASGTVLLELALHRVPMVSIYRLDWLMYRIRFLITAWTAALPNLIADSTIVPERMNEMVRPHWLARALQALLHDQPTRQAQLDGFAPERQKIAIRSACLSWWCKMIGIADIRLPRQAAFKFRGGRRGTQRQPVGQQFHRHAISGIADQLVKHHQRGP